MYYVNDDIARNVQFIAERSETVMILLAAYVN